MAGRGTVRVSITGDTSGLERATRSAERDISRFGDRGSKALRGLATAAKVAGVALAGGLAVGAKKSVDAAVDLGEEINKTRVVFRGSEKDILRWSQTTATSLGTSRREALQAAGVFGNMLVPMGLARERAGDMSKRMVELAADMSSFNNASPEETLDALRAGLAGETEPLRRFGVFLSAARLEQEAMNRGIAKGGEELTAKQKALATYSVILKDTKDAQGDFARTSDSLANQQRILKAQTEDLAASVGKALIPPLTDAAGAVSGFIKQMQSGRGAGGEFRRTMESVGAALKTAFEAAKSAVGTAIGAISGFFRRHRSDVESVKRAVQNVGTAMAEVWTHFLLPVLKRVWPGVKAILEGLARLVGGVVRLVSGLLTGDWSRAWDGAKQIVSGAIKAIGGIVRGLTAPIREALSKIGGLFEKLWGAMKRLAGNALSAVMRLFADFVRETLGRLPVIGGKFDDLADKIDRAAGRVDRLGDEIKKVPKNKDVKVNVELGFKDPSLGEGFMPLDPFPGAGGGPSGGPSIEDRVTDGARRHAQKFFGQRIGELPIFGGVRAIAPLAARFGLGVSSFIRPGDPGFHGQGRAMDFAGSARGMLAFARFLATTMGGRLLELIHTPLGFGVDTYRRVPLSFWGADTNAEHFNHVHVAMARGGKVTRPGVVVHGEEAPQHPEYWISTNPRDRKRMLPLLAQAARDVGAAGFAKGGRLGKAVRALGRAGASKAEQVVLAAIAGAESGYRFVAGDGGASITPWQIHMPSWGDTVKRLGYNLKTWIGAARMALHVKRTQGLDAWTMFRNGGYKAHLSAVRNYLEGPAGNDGRRGQRVGANDPGIDWRKRGSKVGDKTRLPDGTHFFEDGSGWRVRGGRIVAQTGASAEGRERWRNRPQLGRSGLDFGTRTGVLDRDITRADTTKGTRDDVYTRFAKLDALRKRRKQLRARLKKINRALKGKLRPDTRQRLLREKSSIVSELASMPGEVSGLLQEITDVDTTGTFSGAVAAFAKSFGLGTPVRDEDLDSGSDPAVERLAEAQEEANRLAVQRLEVDRQLAHNQRTLIQLTKTQGPQILSSVIAMVNGGIGGSAGLGFQTPSFAGVGGLARS